MFAYVARPICLFRYSFADMKVSAARQFSRRIRKDSLSRRSLRASSVEIGPAGVFLIALYKLSASSLEVALSRVLCKAQYIDAYHSSGQSGCAGGWREGSFRYNSRFVALRFAFVFVLFLATWRFV